MPDQTPEQIAEAAIATRITEAVAAEQAKWEGVKLKNAELLGKNRTLSERAAVIGDRTPEEIKADLDYAAKAREEQARAAGNFEELKKIQAQELAKANQRIADLQSGRENDARKRAAIEAISAAGGKVKKLQDPVLKHLKTIEEDGELVVRVVDAKGNVRMMDGQGTPMTPAQLVEEFKVDDDYLNDFAASGNSGSGARNENTTRATGAVVIPKDATPQEYRRLKADAEKRGVAYSVAA